jgi:site-specific DNA recombinase
MLKLALLMHSPTRHRAASRRAGSGTNAPNLPGTSAAAKVIRCAIYTRKSTEEGLDQAFNSLDAQREACAAFIASQRHEGWIEVSEIYDDGGFSGGNMERPAMQQLMEDVRMGKVKVIVVYKVDRLTRALSDFARIVEVLDAAGASFVSVTQSFNTTTSMGRLTLNVLLSFAQFEREVTGERIRDKIAASKKKGMWMGGPVPLGYDVRDRKLAINCGEAATVRHVFRRYLELGSVRDLALDLKRAGIVSKLRPMRDGRISGGTAFGRGGLVHMLRNVVYSGKVSHHADTYDGEHPAIIDVELWNAVQHTLDVNSVERNHGGSNAKHISLLAALVFDGLGRRMTPSHANKGAKRFRYYITHDDALTDGGPAQWRLPAHDLEQIVMARLTAWLGTIGDALVTQLPDLDAATIVGAQHAAIALAATIANGTANHQQAALRSLVSRIDVHDNRVDMAVDASSLLTNEPRPEAIPSWTITAQAARVRRGNNVRLVLGGADTPNNQDDRLISLIVEARRANDLLFASKGDSLDVVAASVGHSRKHLSRLVRLAYLAPDIVSRILDGTQPAALTRLKMLTSNDIPLDWNQQRVMFGFTVAN